MQNNTVIEHQIIDPVNMAQNAIDRDQNLKEEIKKKKEELDSRLLSDTEYGQIDKNIKEAQQRRKDIKARLMKNPEVYRIAEDLKGLKKKCTAITLRLSD